MNIGTEYSRKDLQRLAKAEACAVRQETAAPARLVDWTIGAVGTDRVYLGWTDGELLACHGVPWYEGPWGPYRLPFGGAR